MTKVAPISKGLPVLEKTTNFLSGQFLRWLNELRDYNNDGKYNPVITGITNVSAISDKGARFVKTGDVVTVHGVLDLSIVNTSGVITTFSISIPDKYKPLNPTDVYGLSGLGGMYGEDGECVARMNNGVAEFSGVFFVIGTQPNIVSYYFTYFIK